MQTRWVDFENIGAKKGGGGWENLGAKGHHTEVVKNGQTVTLMDYKGAGEIRRIFMTIDKRSERVLRSVTLRCYWDGSEKPAVEVPMGDFMCSVGEIPFENELFANPEGRSYNCYIPMPFKTGAKVTLTNESGTDLMGLCYKIDFLIYDQPREDLLYFHSWFHRSNPVELTQDHVILSKVSGSGRFLGAFFMVNVPELYGETWWGEGEVKMYLDGDGQLPTLVGTGTEDYIGSGWGLGKYTGRYQGCLTADAEAGRWSFYRFHICDPVYFEKDIKVTIQDIGGHSKKTVKGMEQAGLPVIPTSYCGADGKIIPLYKVEEPEGLDDGGWMNFYRSDDFATVAYFYLDQPFSELPKIQSIEERVKGLAPLEEAKTEEEVILVAT